MLSVPHLDREFDYLVSAEQSDDAQPGVRVAGAVPRPPGRRVRPRKTLGDRPCRQAGLAGPGGVRRAGADARRAPAGRRRRGALRGHPRRRAAAGDSAAARQRREARRPPCPAPPTVAPVDTARWAAYGRGEQFLAALGEGRAARAVWQALPGEQWADRLAEAAAVAVGAGRGVLADRARPARRRLAARAAVRLVDEPGWSRCRRASAPPQRYRRWLSVLRGTARLVIGTRSAVFAPVADLGLVLVWDDGDDTLAEPRAPYPHAREVAMLRAHQLRCAALIGGYARTAEAQALVRSRWAHDLVAARPVVRARAPRVIALDDSGYAHERDPAAHTRPAAVDGPAGRADGAATPDRPVLVQVPRRGYVPALACARCRTIARCRHCTGPMSLPDRDAAGAVCRWCGRADAALRCARCGSDAVRAVVVGARRTAEELGRAFPGTTVITSGGDTVISTVPGDAGPRRRHPGRRAGGDGRIRCGAAAGRWALLGRQDLRAAEDTLRRWMAAAALVRCACRRRRGRGCRRIGDPDRAGADPLGSGRARRGRTRRTRPRSACRLLCTWPLSTALPRPSPRCCRPAQLPDAAELLGPVELPTGARRPPGTPARRPGQADAGAGAALRRPRAGRGATAGHRRAQRPPRSAARSGANRPVAHRVMRDFGTPGAECRRPGGSEA